MSRATEYIKERIKWLETNHGFQRQCVKNGAYVMRDHVGKDIDTTGPDVRNVFQRIGEYVSLVTLDDRFVPDDYDFNSQVFFEKMVDNHIPSSKDHVELALDMVRDSVEIVRLARTWDVTGYRKNEHVISNLCSMIASSALRLRDQMKGFSRLDSKVVMMKSGT